MRAGGRAIAGELRFVEKPQRGRPTNDARDVAAYLASHWFETGRPMPEAHGVRSPVRAAMELWSSRGFQGLADQKNARALIERGQALLENFTECLFEDGEREGARVFAMPAEAVLIIDGRPVAVNGPCWAWTFGSEFAQFGDACGDLR